MTSSCLLESLPNDARHDDLSIPGCKLWREKLYVPALLAKLKQIEHVVVDD